MSEQKFTLQEYGSTGVGNIDSINYRNTLFVDACIETTYC